MGAVRRDSWSISNPEFRTFRFKSSVIEVSGNDTSVVRGAVRLWSPTVKFRFVSSRAKIGIHIITSNLSGNTCANAAPFVDGKTGEFTRCLIKVRRKACNDDPLDMITMVAHEVGHCLGFGGHTTDSGIMDSDGGIGAMLTSRARKMIKLLYSLPPGTNIEPYL